MRGTLWRITFPNACFGVVVWSGHIVEAAPIAGWAVGKSAFWYESYVARKGGTIEVLGPDPRAEG